MELQVFMDTAAALLMTALGKIITAILVFVIGRIIIGKLLGFLKKAKGLEKMDATVRSFLLNFARAALYIILVIAIISVLGVPMASVITVLASAGVAVGLALQGALSNLAGGIMLLIFRPFNVDDYIVTSGEEGVVKEISLFYTVLLTTDNRKVTIPNGTLMGANVTNCTSEGTRRVDLSFSCAKGEDIAKIRGLMLDVMQKHEQVFSDPAPFAELSGGTNDSMVFTARAWCNAADYWAVYFDLTRGITEAMGAAGVQAPAARVITESR